MTYNIHPLFVHFPIALLFVYSIIKIIPLQKWFPAVAWKHIQRVLLLGGVIGAFFALSTGETAEHLIQHSRELVETHSLFATIATWIFAVLLIGELLSLLMPWISRTIKSVALVKLLSSLKNLLTHPVLSAVLAIIGLIAISVTGLLGGVIVYGTTADPAAATVLKILGIEI